jgi:hypothetical protein
LNPYLNSPSLWIRHRDDQLAGKGKRTYRREDYRTPYEKLGSLPEREKWLKEGITVDAQMAGGSPQREQGGTVNAEGLAGRFGALPAITMRERFGDAPWNPATRQARFTYSHPAIPFFPKPKHQRKEIPAARRQEEDPLAISGSSRVGIKTDLRLRAVITFRFQAHF